MNNSTNINAINASTATSKPPVITERRRSVRHSFSAAAEVVEVVSGTRLRMNARVADLSLGGCYLDTINPFAPETRAHLRIQYRDANFTCAATVKNSVPGMGMGMAFDDLDQPHKDQLQSWLDDSTSETPSVFSVEDSWKDPLQVAPRKSNSTDLPHANGNGADAAQANTSSDEFSLRLAKLLLMKGVLSGAEMARLLGKEIL